MLDKREYFMMVFVSPERLDLAFHFPSPLNFALRGSITFARFNRCPQNSSYNFF